MFPKIKDLYRFNKHYPPEKEIGIEIEMEGSRLMIRPNATWSVHRDGSLRGQEAIEYIIKGPTELSNVNKVLTKLVDLMNTPDREYRTGPAKLEPSDRCGVHVHINVQDMIFTEVFNFMFLYLMLEHVLVGYCGESREGNMFCLRGSDAEYLINSMMQTKETSDLGRLGGPVGGLIRYSSMNPAALFKFGSVEFRALKTPENLMEIEEWVKILHRVKEASLKYDDPVQVVEQYSMEGEGQFFDNIMGDMAPILRKKVDNIEDRLLEGMRVAQDIAYTPTLYMPQPLSSKKKKKTSDMWLEPPAPRGLRGADFVIVDEGVNVQPGHLNWARGAVGVAAAPEAAVAEEAPRRRRPR